MRVHVVQHVSFETPGLIAAYAEEHGWPCSSSLMWQRPVLPRADDLDCLVVMGGPMSAYDDDTIPWLGSEKQLIDDAVRSGKRVLGVCLGAQLIASVLGAKVYPGPEKEIGWFPVRLTEEGRDSRFFRQAPAEITPLHWHGDTFDLPKGALRLASSDLTLNQAFSLGTTVLALQFHLEMGPSDARSIVEHCAGELQSSRGGRFVQSPAEICNLQALEANAALCRSVLAAFFRT